MQRVLISVNDYMLMKYKCLFISVLLLLSSSFAMAKPGIDSLFKAYNMRGSFLAYENKVNKYTVFYDARCKKAYPPDSTFQIVESLMALECSIAQDAQHIIKWNGNASSTPQWDKDMSLVQAFSESSAPQFETLRKEIGAERTIFFLDRFSYCQHSLDSTLSDKLNSFWRNGDIKLSSYDQVHFLNNITLNILNAKKKNLDIIKSMMIVEDNEDYRLCAKGGLITGKKGFAWYIGWIETADRTLVFAMNYDVREESDTHSEDRNELVKDIFRYLDIIK